MGYGVGAAKLIGVGSGNRFALTLLVVGGGVMLPLLPALFVEDALFPRACLSFKLPGSVD